MSRVGRYEIAEPLGQGGMGTVYKAYDPLLERVVAVKVISAQFSSQPDLRERFFREARAVARLDHPNIVTVYDLGEQDGMPYLAMQFLEGRDLEHRMRAPEGMALLRKVEVALAIAAGLAHAHGSGIVHRDVKPANIFITDDGQIKILDFGLARLVTSELTRSNMMVGTVNYMAPEQLRGEKTDHRVDIFSLGVVLYELLGGRKPFQAESFASIMYKILEETPEPLERLDPALPPRLIAVVDRAIAKAREDRYQLMFDLLRDLEAAYEPIRGADYHVVSRIEASLRTPQDRPRSDPPTAIPASDAPTIVGTVAEPRPPSAERPLSRGTAASAPTVVVTPERSSSRRIAAAAAGLIAVAAVLLVFLRAQHQPARRPDALNRSAEAQRPAAAAPAPAVPTAPAPAAAAAPEPPASETATKPPERDTAAPPERATPPNVARMVRQARAAIAASRRDEAARIAAEALALDPSNQDARQIAASLRAADQEHLKRASAALRSARDAAVAANAADLAAGLFVAAERQAQSAKEAGDRQQFAMAAARMDAATTLYSTAEATARQQADAKARAKDAEAVRAAEQLPAKSESPKAAPPPPAPPPAPAMPAPAPKSEPAPAVADDGRAMHDAALGVLRRYVSALEHRDIGALKAVWPGLQGREQSAIESEFENAKSVTVTFANPKVDVSGTGATVSGLRRYSLRTRDGQDLRSETLTTLALKRVGTEWQIDSVRHQPAR